MAAAWKGRRHCALALTLLAAGMALNLAMAFTRSGFNVQLYVLIPIGIVACAAASRSVMFSLMVARGVSGEAKRYRAAAA